MSTKSARIDAGECLDNLEGTYASITSRLTALRRGATEKFRNETEYCWRMLSELLPKIRRAERDYCPLVGVRCGE